MKIKLEKKEQIEKLLNEVAGKLDATVSYQELLDVVNKHIKKELLLKKDQAGVQLIVNGFCGELPRAYKYKKEFISVTLELFSSGYYVVDITRDSVSPRTYVKSNKIRYGKDQEVKIKQILLENFLGSF